jgi:hypothetical protein
VNDITPPGREFQRSESRDFRKSVDTRHAGGALQLQLACFDRSGHARVTMRLLDQPRTGGASRSVEFTLPVEASAVDAFVAALRRWGPTVGDVAVCAGAA